MNIVLTDKNYNVVLRFDGTDGHVVYPHDYPINLSKQEWAYSVDILLSSDTARVLGLLQEFLNSINTSPILYKYIGFQAKPGELYSYSVIKSGSLTFRGDGAFDYRNNNSLVINITFVLYNLGVAQEYTIINSTVPDTGPVYHHQSIDVSSPSPAEVSYIKFSINQLFNGCWVAFNRNPILDTFPPSHALYDPAIDYSEVILGANAVSWPNNGIVTNNSSGELMVFSYNHFRAGTDQKLYLGNNILMFRFGVTVADSIWKISIFFGQDVWTSSSDYTLYKEYIFTNSNVINASRQNNRYLITEPIMFPTNYVDDTSQFPLVKINYERISGTGDLVFLDGFLVPYNLCINFQDPVTNRPDYHFIYEKKGTIEKVEGRVGNQLLYVVPNKLYLPSGKYEVIAIPYHTGNNTFGYNLIDPVLKFLEVRIREQHHTLSYFQSNDALYETK